MQPQLNEQTLTEDQRSKLELYYQSQNQLKALKEIADMTQEMVGLLSDKGETESLDNMGVLLTDIRESLAAMKDKEAPESPDYAKPVVDAVLKLEKALSASIKAIDVKPNVTVDAPQVNVEGARVDLKGIEEIMGTLPDAFKQAIVAFPKPEKPDYAPLLDAWEGISEQLVSIENATRMKPLPGSMAIRAGTSTIGSVYALDTAYITQFYSDSTYTYICKAVPATALASSLWQVKRIASDGSKRYAGGNANFTKTATDLATVQGYSYS